MEQRKKLLKKIEITGCITLKTGLHIGGTNSAMNIGCIDKSVIRNPLTNQPFIPGSSLKGKMRSLFEVAIGAPLKRTANLDNGPAQEGPSADLYGNAAGGKSQIPSRLIVRDCNLINAEELLQKTEVPYTEGKTEVTIDRITSAANPRQIERVPAGAKFELNMIINIWEHENQDTLVGNMLESLQLLKDDYLGGSGSRGYGHLNIEITDMLEKTVAGFYEIPDGKAISILGKYADAIKKLHDA